MSNSTDFNSPVIDCQRAHRSVRHYTDEPITDSLLAMLIESAQSAASSSFIQAYSVVRVNRPVARERIAKAAGGQRWIEQAPVFLVCCADLRRIDLACREQDRGELEGWSEHSLAAVVDCALFGQNLLLGRGVHWAGGSLYRRNPHEPQVIADELALPDLVMPVFGLCLGWPERACLGNSR